MYQVPRSTQTMSKKLTEVLVDIGVDERMVLKRRRTWLLSETILNINSTLIEEDIVAHNFGSQSEGTTTIGMNSDNDQLIYSKIVWAIQNLSDSKPSKVNHLMIQDNSAPPGYCFLQLLGTDNPPPGLKFVFKASTGKLLVKNSMAHVLIKNGYKVHGPAYAIQGNPGFCDKDSVMALQCTTWPHQATQWLDQHGEGQWPSVDMKQYCSRTGCFIVGVGCSGSENEQFEWRISTSLAERCLMFNLNITQIRCYVLMKMILKTFNNSLFKDVITSFMCKTVLFHCVSNTPSYTWRENNLLNCLLLCLYFLNNSIMNENCPHFIIPGNNLMRGKISPAVKPYIIKTLNAFINSKGMALHLIKCDDLGFRLYLKLNNIYPIIKSDLFSGTLLKNLACALFHEVKKMYYRLLGRSAYEVVEILKNCIRKTFFFQYEGLEETASLLLLPMYHTLLGSVLASININHNNTVSADAFGIISLGLNSDVASSKLKLASILYCVQEMQETDLVLSEIERRYDLQIVEPFCICHIFEPTNFKQGFGQLCDNYNEVILQFTTASCVKYLPCEIHCVPNELRYEWFRSTQEERKFRTFEDGIWMDCAVVDSLPYLYFLQYKVYSHLWRLEEKQAALANLDRTINEEPNLGHRETALNLLGKCLEQEGRAGDALHCYTRSLRVRGRNNAAKIHICILLSALISTRTLKLQLKCGNDNRRIVE
ncbi:uncharacterized protein LOC132731772 [Ruditapes philippinarum]|uniref:uncharacterized protein LOC132731772 n=1 Tax=Ruditapes philippinarum TaxID=129788 RepID=UPI00295C2F40|nr:uncharacterized protein LOC132731772 [Ruditapes philippinarum]